MTFSVWDGVLVAAVATQATVLAYIYRPRWKALMLNLPIPFTLATLALGRRVDVTNVAGLVVLLGFTYAVWLLHGRRRWNIALSIVLSASGYCVVGGALAYLLTGAGDAAFWIGAALAVALAAVLFLGVPPREEPGHRSPLPVWIKLPTIVAVVGVLVAIKQVLGGFMTVFPMVGVVAAYEARRSLRTICRQIPVIILSMTPMMVLVRYAEPGLGRGGALAAGWAALLGILIPLMRWQWRREARTAVALAEGAPPPRTGRPGASPAPVDTPSRKG